MSTENITAFLAKVQTDRELAAKLVLVTAEVTAKLAEQEGLAFSSEEFLQFQTESLSDAELEGVAGGSGPRMDKYVDPNFTNEQRVQRGMDIYEAAMETRRNLSVPFLINKLF